MRKTLNQLLVCCGLIVAWAVICLWAPPSFLKVGLSASFLLLVPGHFIYRLIMRDDKFASFWATLGYTISFSSLYLMLLGLVMSAAGPPLGVARPLEAAPLTIAISVTTALLAGLCLALRGNIAPKRYDLPKGVTNMWLMATGAVLPVLAVLGAIRLNNGASNVLTLIMFAVVCVYAIWLVWLRATHAKAIYPYALFMMALAILLSTSMRGWFITGHDIVQEYQVFQLTATHGVWSMQWLQNAYTACLSITILPTILQKLTGLSDPYVFKILFQFMFALVPPVIYLALNNFLPRQAALLSAFVFITFPTFLTDMPMLCRQETAFLFFFLGLLALFNSKLSPRARSGLFMLMGLGMILSHYSTSYVAMGIVLAAKFFELALNRWDRWRHGKGAAKMTVMPISWPLAIALLLTVYLWNSLLTNTGEGITSTIGGIAISLPRILDNTTQTGVAAYSIVGHTVTNAQIFSQYTGTVKTLRDLPANAYYPQALTSLYPLQTATEVVAKATSAGTLLTGLHVPLYAIYDAAKSGYAKLVQILMLGGLVLLAFKRTRLDVPRQFLILGFASVVMIVLEVLLPSVINYGLLRLIQQCLVFLAPAIVASCYWVFGLLKFTPAWRVRATALIFVGFFMVNSGLLPAFTGDYTPSLTSANAGFYYQAYYAHADEIAGYSWMAQNTPTGAVVNADEFARRQMITYANIYARPSLAPSAISQDAYVYLSYGDTTFNEVPLYFGSSLIYEQPPTAFLNTNKNLLYTNGAVKIYR